MHDITRHSEVATDARAHPEEARGVRSRRRRRAGVGAVLGLFVLGVLGSPVGSPAVAHSEHDDDGDHHGSFVQTDLVSDIPGRAQLLDEEVKNPWGISFGPDTALWVNNNFSPAAAAACPEDDPECIPDPEDLLTKITLYRGANGVDPIAKVPLEVEASSPTGTVFNPTSSFKIRQGGARVPARFLFNETFVDSAGTQPEGRITGWSPVPNLATTTTNTPAVKDPALPFGLALVPAGRFRGPRLLVADGFNNVIDVYNSRFRKIDRPGLFVDPKAEAQGLALYNVAFLKGRVYVAYVGASESAPGAVSVFRPGGRFIKRLVTSTRLVGPWGMAIAPEHWGRFGGRLLVGNVDNGMINAFDRRDGRFSGTLRDAEGEPLVNVGLWGVAFGNGVIGTPRTLIFAAGIGDEVDEHVYEHGLVGAIEPSDHEDDDD